MLCHSRVKVEIIDAKGGVGSAVVYWYWSTCYFFIFLFFFPAPSVHTPALSLSVCVASGAAFRPRVPVSMLFANCVRVFWGVFCFTVGGGHRNTCRVFWCFSGYWKPSLRRTAPARASGSRPGIFTGRFVYSAVFRACRTRALCCDCVALRLRTSPLPICRSTCGTIVLCHEVLQPGIAFNAREKWKLRSIGQLLFNSPAHLEGPREKKMRRGFLSPATLPLPVCMLTTLPCGLQALPE